MPETGKRNWAAAALLGCLFALMLFLNFHTFLTADDFMFTLHRLYFRRIESVPDIVDSLKTLRRNVNGRVIAHFFAHLFLFWPKPLFNVVNAGVCTGLFYILYRYVRSGDRGRDALALLFLLAAVWLLTPAFGQVYLWLTGSCNYSWTMFFTLLFLLPFFRAWTQREAPFPPRAAALPLRVLYLALAFLAGAYSENGSLAMLFSAGCFLLLCLIRDRRLPGFLCAAFLTACGGFLFLMLAPSELSGRRGEVSESTLTKAAARLWALLSGRASTALLLAAGLLALLLAVGLILLLIRRRVLGCRVCGALLLLGGAALVFWLAPRGAEGFGAAALAFLTDTRICLLLALILYLLLMLRALETGVEGTTLLAALVLGLAALASVAVFLFAVYFPARSSCPFITYTALADALLLQALWAKGRRRALPSLAAALALAMLLTLPAAVGDIRHSYAQALERDAYLRWAETNRPGEIVVVEPITPRSKYSACWPGDEDYFLGEIVVYYNLYGFGVTEYVN